MRQTALAFKSKKLNLEGVLATPSNLSPPYPAAVVCHSHPKLGGTMESAVVTAICRRLDQHGFATLRFNFRGVGQSEGTFSKGTAEREDLEAALRLMQVWRGVNSKRMAAVGYSFGAHVILQGLARYKAARALVLIAPPLAAFRGVALDREKRPTLFLVGTADKLARREDIREQVKGLPPPAEYVELPGADHSLRGHEEAVAEQVSEFLSRALAS